MGRIGTADNGASAARSVRTDLPNLLGNRLRPRRVDATSVVTSRHPPAKVTSVTQRGSPLGVVAPGAGCSTGRRRARMRFRRLRSPRISVVWLQDSKASAIELTSEVPRRFGSVGPFAPRCARVEALEPTHTQTRLRSGERQTNRGKQASSGQVYSSEQTSLDSDGTS